MNKEESTIRQLGLLETNIDYIALSIVKLDKYFSNKTAAEKYLQPNGWLNEIGMDKFREKFHPMTICAILLSMCCLEVPKTQEVVDTINEKIAALGCKVQLRNNTTNHYFSVQANNFFWFGGLPIQKH